MTGLASVSPHDLRARRAQLKRRRQRKLLQALWRLLLVSSMAGGLAWGVAQLNWTLDRDEQIDIKGNQLLSPGAIRALLPLSYPQSLWELQPQALSQQLEAAAPIAEASIARQLLPPGLAVTVRERQPVARILNPRNPKERGFLDKHGIFLPERSYPQLLSDARLPELQVQGLDETFRSSWPEIYQTLSSSSVRVSAIDFRNPSNLVLKTELGTVRLGQYQPGSSRFAQQLAVLAKMRELPHRLPSDRLAYIDLSNPELPTVQLR